MCNILDVKLDMDFVLAGEKCHLLNRSIIPEYRSSQETDDIENDGEEYRHFNLKDVLCQILNFDTQKWESALKNYILEVNSNIKDSKNSNTTNCSNLFILSDTIPFMFKPVQLVFLIEEVSIYFNLTLDTEDLQQPCPFNLWFEDYSDFFLKIRNGICDMFIEQNRNNLQSTTSGSIVDYLYIRGAASINSECVYPKFSCYGFSQLVAECNEIYQKWSKLINRSSKNNYQKMVELLADSSLEYYQCDNPTANVSYRTNVLNKIPGVTQNGVYKVKSLGNLFYLLLSHSSKCKPLKKCYTCNSYYANSTYNMYCGARCKDNDVCTNLYNKLNNRYIQNTTKYQEEQNILNNLHFLWKNRDINNETFLQLMNELQEKK